MSSYGWPSADLPYRSVVGQVLAPLASSHRGESISPISPFPSPLKQATTTSSFVAGAELLPAPFQPPLSLSLPTVTLPGCASLENMFYRRRRSLSTTGVPAPLLSLLSVCSWRKREEAGGRRKKKKKKKREKEKEKEKV
uniref:Uncharacterized protein n=1 Tax=Oryza barthii TaxID=65489 RepID=A0A0D3GXJ4_9ORYZ